MGLEHVSDETTCREALSQFYNISVEVEDTEHFPSGCYKLGGHSTEGYFNEDIPGTPRYQGAHTLCKAGNYRI